MAGCQDHRLVDVAMGIGLPRPIRDFSVMTRLAAHSPPGGRKLMSDTSFNKYRAAIQVLQKGRDVLVDSLAEEVLSQADDLLEGGFLFNEFLEAQGTRLHFLSLLVSQLEQSADSLDEAVVEPPPPP